MDQFRRLACLPAVYPKQSGRLAVYGFGLGRRAGRPGASTAPCPTLGSDVPGTDGAFPLRKCIGKQRGPGKHVKFYVLDESHSTRRIWKGFSLHAAFRPLSGVRQSWYGHRRGLAGGHCFLALGPFPRLLAASQHWGFL